MLAGAAFASGTNHPSVAVAETNLCAQFTLRDQFNTQHELKFPHTKPTVLTVADKQGSDGIRDWAQPLAKQFGDQIEISGLADVSTVPGVMHGMVRSKFRKAFSHPVMLDWDGQVTRSFRYTKGEPNIFLIAADGRILLHLTGKATAANLRELASAISAILQKNAQANARSN